jgi:hypothetical protein
LRWSGRNEGHQVVEVLTITIIVVVVIIIIVKIVSDEGSLSVGVSPTAVAKTGNGAEAK